MKTIILPIPCVIPAGQLEVRSSLTGAQTHENQAYNQLTTDPQRLAFSNSMRDRWIATSTELEGRIGKGAGASA